jgi:hypothetical protein
MKVKCPTCKAKTDWNGNEFRPFCSDRCRLLDLGKWLNEEYSVKCEEEDPFSIQDSDLIH